MEKKLPTPLRGIIVPLVTPLTDNNTLDIKGLERLIEHTIAGGVTGIFILGTTGEFASISYELRNELIEQTCKIVNNRVFILVGIADSSFTESIKLANKAAKSGADAVVLTPPYYFKLGQPELLEYLEQIMKQMPLPLYLYNMPYQTKIEFSPETVKAIAKIPGVVGIKDSSANLPYFKLVQFALRDNPEFTFMVGPEEIMSDFVLSGGHGGVNGGANMFPKLYVDLYNASVDHDFEKIKELQQKVIQICSTIYKVGNYNSSYLKGLKCALSIMGICSDFMAEPFKRFNEPERKKIKEMLEELNYRELL